jgi:DNA repair exonuclease SbcCD nuclease subunit
MKILHCSDLHLGRRPVGGVGEYSETRFSDYFNSFHHIADYAAENSIDAVIISGDIFDRREITPDILERAEQVFIKLKDSGIETIIAEGNHDRGGSSDSTWLNYLVHRDLVKMPGVSLDDENNFVFEPVKSDGVHFYSMGYPGIYIEDMSRSLVDVLDGEKINIILVHTAISSNDHFPGTVTPAVIDLFKGKAFYIAGGHFHSYHHYPADEPYFFVPGAPEYWDLAEGEEKYFIVFDTSSGARESISTRRRKKTALTYSFTSMSDSDFEEEFDHWLSAISIDKNSVVTCLFKIEESLYPDGAACEKKIESAGALKSKVSFVYKNSGNTAGRSDEQIVTTESIESENLINSGYSGEITSKIVNDYLPELKKTEIEGDNGSSGFDLFDRMIEEIIQGK